MRELVARDEGTGNGRYEFELFPGNLPRLGGAGHVGISVQLLVAP